MKKTEIFPLLFEACPGFRQKWEEYRKSWGDDAPGEYIYAAEFARYLVESYERGFTDEFPIAFSIIERIIVEGDQDARDIAVIGIIEDIQHFSSHRPFGGVFEKWLLPMSRQGWDEVAQAWEGKSSLMDVVRAEVKSKRRASKRWWEIWK